MPEMKQSTERWKKIRAKVFVAWIEKNEKITWKQQITSKRFLQA